MTQERTDQEMRILVLAPAGRDGALSQRLLAEAGLAAEVCADAGAVCRELEAGWGALLLTRGALGPPALSAMSACLEHQPAWSGVPIVIVLGAGELSRAQVLPAPLRNATYLERPVRIVTL